MDKRQKAVREYLLGGCSYRQLEEKYGVSHATINRYVRKFKACQQAKLKGIPLPSDPMKHQRNQEQLPDSIEQLQKQLEQERLRNKLLTTMLEIAEDELQIPIRKKFGTKQSQK
jgi:transposase